MLEESRQGSFGAIEAPRKSSGFLTKLHHVYRVTCKRHPWIEGYVITVANPYVVRSSSHNAGSFTLDGVPIGRRTLRVWHPKFKPVREAHEFEIRKDETTEIVIEFQPPGN